MAKESKLAKSKVITHTGAKTEEFATKIFAKSDYPKTVKDNIKLVINFFINFLS